MTVQQTPRRSFFSKNLGAAERMLWAFLGLVLMTVGFEGFNAIALNSGWTGVIIVLIGFLVFLQAPMSWSLTNAIKGRSTFESDHAD